MKKLLFISFLLVSFSVKSQNDTIPFQIKDGIIFIEATANDKKAYFIVDCGSSYSFINEGMSRKFNFNSETIHNKIAGFGGEGSMYHITSDLTIKFDEVSIKNGFRKSADLTQFSKIFKVEVGGLLGNDFLAFCKATIDYRNQVVLLSR